MEIKEWYSKIIPKRKNLKDMYEIQKQDLTSMNIAEEQLRKLKELFPEAFTEGLSVDWDKLRLTLGQSIDVGKERYGMNWPGKADCFKTIQQPSIATLIPARDESVDFDKTENLFIEGDNLEVLKLLQKSYLGKIKFMYFDPPYNTGSDFIYPDNYSESLETYLEYTGQVDADGRKFGTNTDTDGRFHSKWMNMMYPRLFLSKNLLTENGLIFISIGVEELCNLKQIMDEIFGEENFVEVFSWVKTSTPPALSKKSRKTNEYILCYEKNLNSIKYNGELLDGGDQPLLNSGNSERELIFPCSSVYFVENKFPNGIYKPNKIDRVELLDEIEIFNGYSKKDFRLKGEFKWTQTFLNEEILKGTKFIIKSDKLSIRFIRDEEGSKRPTNFIKEKYTSPLINKPVNNVGTNENASSELRQLMGNDVFSYPKPVSLIKYLINFVCTEGDIALDIFAGSGTTGESVMNWSLTNKKRLNFILVQLPENLDDNLRNSDSNSRKIIQNGIDLLDEIKKPHYLSELTKERIRRSSDFILKELKEEQQKNEATFFNDTEEGQIDLGFKVFKLSKSNFKIWDSTLEKEPEAIQTKLFEHINHISPEAEQEAILYELLLKSGFELTTPIEKLTLAGLTVFSIAEGQLLICLEKELTHDCLKAMAEMQPTRVICLDEGFKGENADALKTNAVQIMKSKGVVNFRTV